MMNNDFKTAFDAYHFKRDYITALRICTEIAGTPGHHDMADALYILGLIYSCGDGVEQDFAAALGFLRRAVALNHIDAHFVLGNMFSLGEGVDPNEFECQRLHEIGTALRLTMEMH